MTTATATWKLEKPLEVICAGFGGQGVMLVGQLLTYAGMAAGKHVSWIPSYGPEMRGGTANCGVVVSEDPIGSPLVTEPSAAVIMNAPSLDKFEPLVVPGGSLIINASMVTRKVQRDDVEVAYIDASQLAIELGNPKVVSGIMLGALIEMLGQPPMEAVEAVLGKMMKEKLIPINIKAMHRGAEVARAQRLAAQA